MRSHLFVITFALLALAVGRAARAQEGEGEHFETDRDSFTPATVTVDTGRLILESGYSFIDNRDVPDSHSFPEAIARYGITDWLELRVGANYEVGGAPNSVSGNGGGVGEQETAELESEAKVLYGFKAALTEQDGWRPRSIAIVQGNTPTAGAETATHLVATYAWGWEFAEGWLWDSSIRYGDGADEEDHFNAGPLPPSSNYRSPSSGTPTSNTSESSRTAAMTI
jgi:hypothetical protein